MTAERPVVRVWLARPDTQWQPVEILLAVLPPYERVEADRCAGQEIRERFVRRRALRRAVLAELLSCPPADVPLRVASGGKPDLRKGGPAFSASSSGPFIALAVRTDGEAVGLDVQLHQRVGQLSETAARFFPPTVGDRLAALPPLQRHDEFVRQWTRYEAMIKLTGEGIAPVRTRGFGVRRRPGRVQVQMLATPPRLVGAVCSRSPFTIVVGDVPPSAGGVRLLISR